MTDKQHQSLACKVVHIIPHDGIGGVEVAARSMLNSDFLNNNFKLFFIAGKSLSKNKKNVIESPFRSANNPLAHLRAIFKIYNESPDVLVCSLWRSVPVGIFIKLLKPKTKLVFFLHLAGTVHILDTFFHKAMLGYCDYILADSQATLNARINNVSLYKNYIISFVTQRRSPLIVTEKPELLSFVFWGSISQQKGLDRAIQFIKVLVDAGYHCQYDIWGADRGEQEKLIELITSLDLSEHITFKGLAEYSNLQKISAKHCFYLQLSRVEGMAMSVVESMQLGLVPIVTPVGEIANYCVDKNNSIVVNDVDDFKNSIDFLISVLDDKTIFTQLRAESIDTWKDKLLYESDFISAINQMTD